MPATCVPWPTMSSAFAPAWTYVMSTPARSGWPASMPGSRMPTLSAGVDAGERDAEVDGGGLGDGRAEPGNGGRPPLGVPHRVDGGGSAAGGEPARGHRLDEVDCLRRGRVLNRARVRLRVQVGDG